VPSWIGELENLTSLYLQSNQFNGNLPSELGDLTKLETLWIHDNKFTGIFPTGIESDLNFLKDLCLRHNNFTGRVPIEIETNHECPITENDYSCSIIDDMEFCTAVFCLVSELPDALKTYVSKITQ
jgi:hypothetical protein